MTDCFASDSGPSPHILDLNRLLQTGHCHRCFIAVIHRVSSVLNIGFWLTPETQEIAGLLHAEIPSGWILYFHLDQGSVEAFRPTAKTHLREAPALRQCRENSDFEP